MAEFGAMAARNFKAIVTAHAAPNSLAGLQWCSCRVGAVGKLKALQSIICFAIVGFRQGPNLALQADHAAFDGIALSLVFGPRVG